MKSVCLTSLVTLGVLTPSAVFGQAPTTSLSLTNYQFVSETRVTRTKSNVTYRADLVNTDGALASVTATLTSLNPSSFTVVSGQGTLNFAPVSANSQTTSSNTFTILVDRTVPFDSTFGELQWAFQVIQIAPIANAGTNQMATLGKTVTLNGSGSTNPGGIGTLTYSWVFTSRPAGSTATLINPTSVMPTFVPDVAGTYMITLTVSNGAASSIASVTVSTTQPPAPVANAGPNQAVTLGATVVLNGSGSTNGSGNPLTYAWTLTSKPAGSAATLTSTNTVSPTFVADKAGTYMAQLIVNDGLASSLPSTVAIATSCVKPVANAGPAQVVNINSLVQLNGSGSTDACGLPLTYKWSLISVPTGSAATLSNPNIVNPTFTADLPGTYMAQLIVNNSTFNSDAVTVTITTNPPLAPTANPGPNQTVSGSSTVQLNGSGSDPQNLPLTFQWSFTSKPAGSAAILSSTVIPNPAFVADLAGTYVAQLIVNNGFLSSPAVTVTISTTCSQPTSNPGPNQNVIVGTTVLLNGSGSGDVCHDPLTYAWSFTTRPAGSTATLSGANTVSPTFVADVVGMYVVQLIVNNGVTPSNPATVTVTAGNQPTITLTPNPLTVNTNTNGTLTVTLSSPAGAGDQVVNLSSSNPSIATVPATVTVSGGATSATASVTGLAAGSATITASAGSFTSGTATVNVVNPVISVPPNTTIGLGLSAAFPLSMSQPAPAGGVTVNLTSSDTTKVRVPPSAFIAAGATTPASQPLVTGAGIGSATVTASATNYTSGSGTVTVSAPTLTFSGSPLSIIVGATGNLTLNLTGGQAPAGGLSVNLISGNAGVATVPATVTFAAGATSASLTVTGVGVGGPVTITASAPGITSATASVTVNPVAISFDGTYSGMTEQGKAFSFVILNNAVTSLSYDVLIPGCTMDEIGTKPAPASLTGSHFSLMVPAGVDLTSITATGNINSTFQATGTLSITVIPSPIPSARCTGTTGTLMWTAVRR